MENYCDFEIENGVLTKYWGYDENVTIPDSVTSIEESAFNYCRSLKEAALPEGLESIGYGAFCACGSLCEMEIPEGVTSLGENILGM